MRNLPSKCTNFTNIYP